MFKLHFSIFGIKWLAVFISTALILSGCDSMPSKLPDKQSFNESSDTQLLKKSEMAMSQQKIKVARWFFKEIDIQKLNAAEQVRAALIGAELALEDSDKEQAKYYLNLLKIPKSPLNKAQLQKRDLLVARWYELEGKFLPAARQRVFLASDLSGQAYYSNHEKIWQDLMQVPFTELNSRSKSIATTDLGQWLELAALAKNSSRTLENQAADILLWQKRHSRHPAGMKLPGQLSLLKNLSQKHPTNVALLLPLTGKLAKVGSVIRDGFMASYYDSLQKGLSVPEIQVLDSQRFNTLDDAYNKAIELGAQWVIGPVDKSKVGVLHKRASLPLPTLALNYIDDVTTLQKPMQEKIADTQSHDRASASNLYQFGLSASDEAITVANQAWGDGHKNALILTPSGAWGERVARNFEKYWKGLGGIISGRRYYPERKDYNPDIRHLLNVDDSQRRYNKIRKLLPGNVEFEPRARQDADWLFMVALPSQARQIKPTLAFNFSASLPVYSTSHLYAGKASSILNGDLNGIIFCDAPWLLDNIDLSSKIDQSAGTQGAYARLYALGADVHRVLVKVPMLQALPYGKFAGYTGALSMDIQRKIHRATQCAVFKGGNPHLINAGAQP